MPAILIGDEADSWLDPLNEDADVLRPYRKMDLLQASFNASQQSEKPRYIVVEARPGFILLTSREASSHTQSLIQFKGLEGLLFCEKAYILGFYSTIVLGKFVSKRYAFAPQIFQFRYI